MSSTSFGSLVRKQASPELNIVSAPGANDDKSVVYNSLSELTAQLGSTISRRRADIVGDHIASKVCPVQTTEGYWAILTLSDYKNSDLLNTVQEKCIAAGAIKDSLHVVTVSPYLLLSLSQGEADNFIEVSADNDKSGHFSAFVDIVRYGIVNGASDVHLNVSQGQPSSQVHFTIDGQYTAPQQWRMATERLEELLNVAWQSGAGGGAAVFSNTTEGQCRLNLKIDSQNIMCRWAALATDRGVSVTLRLLKMDQLSERRSLESQGFLPTQIEMFLRAQTAEGGAIVIAGVVNSGKSTTLAELLSMIPQSRKILTLEDPVEYLIPNALQCTVVRSLDGNDDHAFTSKLKTFKRSAGNDILLGEIRDTQTGDALVDITGSGTNLYCTLHAKSNVQIPERLASKAIGVPVDFLASPGILNLLVYQALLPVLCEGCAQPLSSLAKTGGYDRRGIHHDAKYWHEYIKRLERLFDIDTTKLKIKSDDGCKKCARTDLPQLNGYQGRTAVAAMLEPQVDRAILRYIRQGDTLGLQEYCEQLPRTPISDPDMTNKSLMDCALFKALQGQLDPRDIEQKTMSFDTFERIKKKGSVQ